MRSDEGVSCCGNRSGARRIVATGAVWLLGVATTVTFFGSVMGGRLRPFVARGESSELTHRAVRSCGVGGWARLTAVTRGDVRAVSVVYRVVDPQGAPLNAGAAPMSYCPAGRLWAVALPSLEKGWSYRYTVTTGDPDSLRVPRAGELRARFEGDVAGVLIAAHVIPTLVAAFLLLVAFHTALGELAGFRPRGRHRGWVWPAVALFTVGAVALGAIVSGQALGTPWGGWPFGRDVTDTKSEAIVLYWVVLLVLTSRKPRASAVGTLVGTLGTMGLYLIPHGGVS